MRDKEAEILEIGSWEGRSAIFFLNLMPRSRITCVDTFGGAPEFEAHRKNPEYPEMVRNAESRFDANLAPFGGRVEKIKSRSVPALDKLYADNRRFDFIYIDGSHHRDDVLMDSLLCWRMLKEGGIIIWDDYRWGGYNDDSPRPAIDCFIRLHRASVSVIWRGYQKAVKRKQ